MLNFSDTMICTGCCATLDHIVTFIFKQLTQKGMRCKKAMQFYVTILFYSESNSFNFNFSVPWKGTESRRAT